MSQVNTGQPSTAAGQQSGPTLQGSSQQSGPTLQDSNQQSGPTLQGSSQQSGPTLEGSSQQSGATLEGSSQQSGATLEGSSQQSRPTPEVSSLSGMNIYPENVLSKGKNSTALWKCLTNTLKFMCESYTQSQGKQDSETYMAFIERHNPMAITKDLSKDIKRSSSCSKFDVSKFCPLLLVLCKKIAPLGSPEFQLKQQGEQYFEYWLKQAKDLRNELQHEEEKAGSPEFLEKLEKIVMELLEKSIKTLGIAAEEVNRMKGEIEEEFERIRNLPLYGETSALVSAVSDFDEFKAKVQDTYMKESTVRLSSDTILNLGDIFFSINLVTSDGSQKNNATIDFEGILANTDSSFVIVKGVPGSGKTTLLRTLFKSWSSQNDEERKKSKALHFNIAVMIACRDRKNQSLAEILQQTYPETFFFGLSADAIKRALTSLTILAIIDGYDERNILFDELMEDVIVYQKTHKERMRVVISSRPEAAGKLVQDLVKRGISTHETTMAPVTDKSRYLTLYEEALVKKGKGEGLVEAFSTLDESVQDFLDTPFLLTIFVKLYTFNKESVTKWKTQIDIMSNYIDMIQDDIIARVEEGQDDQGKTPTNPSKLGGDILQRVCSLALKMYAEKKINLDKNEYLELNKSGGKLSKLSEKTFGSVLSCVLTPDQSATGTGRHYAFGHLAVQEVLAATLVTKKLESNDPQSTESASQNGDGHDRRRTDGATTFKRVIKEITGVKVKDMTRYANIVKYVTLLLNKHQKLKSHGPILADVMRDIMSAMRGSNILDNPGLDYCLDVIAASGCDESVAELVTRALEESGGVGEWWKIRAGNLILPLVIMLRLLKQQEGVKHLRVELKEALTAPHWTALGELVDVISQRYSHAWVYIQLYHSHEECVPVDASVVKKMKGIKKLHRFTGWVAEEESLLALRDWQWWYGNSRLDLSTPKPGLLHLLGVSDGRCGAGDLYFTVPYTEQDLPARPLPVGCRGDPPKLYIKGCPEDDQEQQLIDLIVKLAPKNQKKGRVYEGYEALYLTHCGMTEESVEAVLGGLQQRHVRTYNYDDKGGNTRAERKTYDDGKCHVGYISHTHQDGTVCWRLYLKD